MDHRAVAQALAEAAKAVIYTGPGGQPVQLSAHAWAKDAIDPPCFEVGEFDISFDTTFGAPAARLCEVVVTGRLYAARADDQFGQQRLQGFLAAAGSASLKQALEVDRTLGGLVQALRVERINGYGRYEVAGKDYYGARVFTRVWGRG